MINEALRPLPIFYAADETRVGFRRSKGGRFLSLPSQLLNGGAHGRDLSGARQDASPDEAEMLGLRALVRRETEAHFDTEDALAGDDALPDRASVRETVRRFLEGSALRHRAGTMAVDDAAPAEAQRDRDDNPRTEKTLAHPDQDPDKGRYPDAGDVLVELFSPDRLATREKKVRRPGLFRREGMKMFRRAGGAAVPVDLEEIRSGRLSSEEALENADAIRAVLRNLQGRAKR